MKELCRKVWTSYGIGSALLPFFTVLDQIEFQLLNKFAYDIIVSRVISNLAIRSPVMYFTWRDAKSFRDKLVVYKPEDNSYLVHSEQSIVSDTNQKLVQRFDFYEFHMIQVRLNLYGYKIRSDPTVFLKYSNITPNENVTQITEMATPPRARDFPSCVNFIDQYIFVIGGVHIS